jgi:outer membrane lipoprotein-sorting protein
MSNFAKNCGNWRRDSHSANCRLVSILVLLAAILLASCAPMRPPAPSLAPVSAAVLLGDLSAQAKRFQTLQGTALLRMTNAGERHSARQVLLFQRPNQFRAEVLSPFGQPVMTVVGTADRLSALVPGEGRFYSGPATADNLYRLVRMPLELKELVQFVFYDVPLLPDPSGGVSVEDSFYRLDRLGPDGRRQELRFDSQRRLRQVRYFADETELLQASYNDLRVEDGLPQTLQLVLPGVDMEVELVWRDVRSNADIPPSRFHLFPPPGVQVLALP